METKICSKCNLQKPLVEFPFANKSAGVRATICKDCKNVAQRARYQANREYIMSIKRRKKCAHCGESRPYMLDFHHPDRDDKISCISKLWTSGSRKLDSELSKCVVLCANCHRLLHYLNIPTEVFLNGGNKK